jgi:hypothetical protein
MTSTPVAAREAHANTALGRRLLHVPPATRSPARDPCAVVGHPGIGTTSRFGAVADDERARLQYFLDAQRGAVLAILEGLDETQLHTPVLPSGWTPAGLLLHLAHAERSWFRRVVQGIDAPVEWDDGIVDPPYDPSAAFTTEHAGPAVIAFYREQCQLSNDVLQSVDLHAPLRGAHGLDWPDEPITDVRWVALHMIEETARHAGHLDAARELLDGVTGLGPR